MKILVYAALTALAALAVSVTSASGGGRPDLEITYAVDAPSPFLAGAQFSTAARVTNDGRARAAASRTRYYLSTDETADASDTVLGTVRASRLRPGRSSLRGVRLEVPRDTAPGTYWVIVCVDATRRIRESNERNNCLTTVFPMYILDD